MATTWKAPTWRMPNEKNQNKFENYGLTFDGSVEKITFDPIALSTDCTLSTWAKRDSTANMFLLGNTATYGYGIYFNGTSNLYIKGTGPGLTTFNNAAIQTALARTDWVHWLFIKDNTAGTTSVYVDGNLTQSVSHTNPINEISSIGGSGLAAGTQYIWNGSISDTTIFDYALSSTQISSLYNAGSPINPMTLKPAPIAYYPLGGNASTGGDITNTLSVPNVAVPDASVFDIPSKSVGTAKKYIETNINNLSDINVTNKITVSAWVNFDDVAVNAYNPIVNKGLLLNANNLSFTLARNRGGISQGQVYAQVKNASSTTVTVYSDANAVSSNEWANVVMRYDGVNVKIYVNGKLHETQAQTGNILDVTPTEPVVIGSDYYYNAGFGDNLVGKVSNVQIWNTDLTDGGVSDGSMATGQILELYNNGQPLMTGTQPQEANLQAWYKLNQSANWEADTVGNWQIPDNRSAYPQSFDFGNRSQAEYIALNQLPLYSAITVSAWIKTQKNGSSSQTIISNNQPNPIANEKGWELAIDQAWSSGYTKAGFVFYDSTGSTAITIAQTSSQELTDNKWHHVVALWDGTTNTNAAKIFVDGLLAGQGTSSFAGPIGQPPIGLEPRIGSRAYSPSASGGGRYFGGDGGEDGFISNVQTWDSSLTYGTVSSIGDIAGGQIAELYNNGVPLTTAIATDNLKAWYKLDNNEIFDGTNWEIENQKYPASFDSALDFDGSSYVDFGNSLTGTNDGFAISFWYYTTSYQVGQIISKHAQNVEIYMHTNGNALWTYFGSQNANTIKLPINLNSWNHVVYSVTSTDVSCYQNGELVGVNTFASTPVYAVLTNDVEIGRRSGSVTQYYTGQLSNIAWFDTTLDSAAVTALYNNGTPETSISSSPVSWWKLDNTTTGIQDSIGTNDGTNNGTTKVNTFVSTEAGASSGMTEQNLVNNNVSALNGESSGMNTSNLVTSTLTRQVPYNSYSLYFDGTSDYVEVPDDASLKPTSAITCSMWFKCGTQNTNRHFLSKYYDTVDGAYGFYTNGSSSDLYFYVTVGGTTYNSPVGSGFFNNNWHHAVGVYDGANIYLHVDGVQQGTSTAQTGSISYNNGILCFASLAGAPTIYEVDTYLNNISIFNEALTSTEIMKLYNSGVPGDLSSFSPSPVSWWSLGSDSYFDGVNYICPDLIGTNNSNSSTGLGINSLIGDAPNSSANGTSTNMTYDANLTGNAPNSSNNSFSVNMSYDDRVSGTGNVPG